MQISYNNFLNIETKLKSKMSVRIFEWYEMKTWCWWVSIEDGVHGVIIWDTLLVLVIAFNGLSTIAYFSNQSIDALRALGDFIMTGFLFLRAIYGWCALRRKFNYFMLRNYLVLRIVWDIVLLLMNIILMLINKINFVSFLFNIVVVISLDGYFNFIVYGFFKLKKLSLIEENPLSANQDIENNEQVDHDQNNNQNEIIEEESPSHNNEIAPDADQQNNENKIDS